MEGSLVPKEGVRAGPEAYKRYVEDEMGRRAPIVKTLGAKIDF
jgi:hypothetical protein